MKAASSVSGPLAPMLGALAVTLPLWVAWTQRDYRYITPERGLGYALGIVGGTLMLLLLLYPLRKRWAPMARLGSVRLWFRVHQTFGVLGPALVVLHSNFSLGSLNGRIALASMLVVAFSGLVGRYLFGRAHHGMAGQREALALLRDDESRQREVLEVLCERVPGLQERLSGLQALLVPDDRGLPAAVLAAVRVSLQAWRIRVGAQRALRREGRLRGRALRAASKVVRAHVGTAVKIAQLDLFDRLLGLWHLLHLPLFILLILTATFHVVAVHMY